MDVNLICDYQLRPEYRRHLGMREKTVYLSVDNSFGNVFLDPKILGRDLGRPLDPTSLDLCEIAAYVYLADKGVSRGRYEKWTRDLSFLVPVRNPDLWNSVKETLTNAVATLSGDNVEFHFFPKTNKEVSSGLASTFDPAHFPDADCSCLFSGGLDSFAGAVHLARQGRRPIFASHYVQGSLKNVQSRLMSTIQAEFGRAFHHFQYRVTSRSNENAPHPYVKKESSHRARSFLFMSFAAVAAALHGLSDILICENGVLSLNVPISDARKGSRSTRHAHPLYLFYFNQLVNALYGRKFDVQNPFFFWTKGEEADLLRDTNLRSRIKDTVTCWGYPSQTAAYPNCNHCGYCLPCIVRRVSLIAAGLENQDDNYFVDVFGSARKLNEKQLRNVEDLAYFCHCFSTLSKTELVYRYPELVMVESGSSSSADDKIGKMIRVYKKFATEFLSVASSRNPSLVAASLPEVVTVG
jgi:7-cyano-7-deazaguanine synthase in queuosine biosynthesis